MKINEQDLPKDVGKLQEYIVFLAADFDKKLSEKELIYQNIIKQKELEIECLGFKLRKALHARFAKKSEALSTSENTQLDLFDEAEISVPEDITPVVEADESIHEPTKANKNKKKTGRKPLPKNLPRVQIIHDLTPAEKICSCGCELSKIGSETSEQLEFIPATVRVIEHVRIKYACKPCEANVKLALMPKQILPKSIATPGLLAHILVSKYNDHLPLYRQESILQRHGIDITRGTLAHWVIKCGELIVPLIKLLQDIIIHYDIAFADETPVQVLKEPGRSPSQKSYLWMYQGGPKDKLSIVYQYTRTREGLHAELFLENFKGYLHVDAYGGYERLTQSGVTLVGCFAHARRKFFDVATLTKNTNTLAHAALKKIAAIYKIESDLKEQAASSETIAQTRQQKSKPLLHDFKIWLLDNSRKIPPKSPIGQAIQYCLNHWNNLIRYIEDGRLEIDNNRSERAIKPFVIGRKNWLFSDSVKGVKASSNIFSLIETAKANNLEPYSYLRYLFTHLPNAHTLQQLENLLPFNITPEQLN
jgi:transposase